MTDRCHAPQVQLSDAKRPFPWFKAGAGAPVIFISSSQALDMLSAHAPRAWAKRVLSWQIYLGALTLYFASGNLTESLPAFHFLINSAGPDGSRSVERVREEYGAEIADAVAKAGEHGRVVLREEDWANDPRWFPIDVITFADEIDWDSGTCQVEFAQEALPDVDEDYLIAQEENSQLTYKLGNMCFELAVIEMIAPNASQPTVDSLSSAVGRGIDATGRKGGPGRRREYDWEGALFHLIGEAEKNSIAPDPDAHGAQADIKRKLADWFSLNGGKVPADSQLQSFAARALDSIRNAKP